MSSQTSFLTFYRDAAQANLYRIDIHDLDNTSQEQYVVKRFSYESDVEADEGSLLVQENTVLIAPHNKQLNLIGGVWYLNDYVSTTPVISSSVRNVANPTTFPTTDSSLTEGVKATVVISVASNGQIAGTLTFLFNGQSFSVPVNPSTISQNQLAQSIYTTLTSSAQSDLFSFVVSSNVVTATALSPGAISFTGQTIGSSLGTGLSITFTNGVNPTFYGGGNGTVIPRLQVNEEYAYTARFVYRDGHKTKTAFPVYIKTTTNRKFNAVNITCSEDLDDGYADIEVFRKIGTNEFFLIDTIRNPAPALGLIEYIDDGKTDIAVLDEKEYVWTAVHKTHAVLRDRYVRANVSYADRDLDVSGIVDVVAPATELAAGDNIVPSNCAVSVFARKRQEDGLLSFHDAVATYKVDGGGDQTLFVQLNSTVPGTKELAVYAKYTGLEPTEFLSFNTPEIYNVNIPSIATHDEATKDQPINTHVFLGWRYITTRAIRDDLGSMVSYQLLVFDEEWDTNVPTSGSSILNSNYILLGTAEASSFPDSIVFDKFGTPITYIKRYVDSPSVGSVIDTVVYEMAMFDGLKTAVSQDKVKIKLTAGPANRGTLSTEARDSDILDLQVDVVGVVDKSGGIFRLINEGTNNVSTPFSPPDSKVYLLLESDSVFSKINNDGLIDFTRYKKNTTPQNSTSYFPSTTDSFFKFVIYGVAAEDWTLSTTTASKKGYIEIENNYFLSDVSGNVGTEALVYLGKLENDTTRQGPLRTGFEKTIQNNFISYQLKETNIYETLVTQATLPALQRDYPNQIIWSEPFVVGTDNSGNRTFDYTNFLNIQRDYGSIIAIEPMLNKLVVFCQRGVAVVLVGEILTQTVGGETVVSAVNFLNSPTWILRNVKPVQPKTIKQYEGALYFSDGQDVWRFTDQLTNLSEGAITLAGSQVGAIDPVNKEYRISGGGKTYSFSTELNLWTGPHTYVDQSSETYRDRMISVVGNNLVEHNTGNDYAGTEFDTVVESVANDLQEGSVDKSFRKFYLEVDGDSTFSYGKDYSDMTDKDLADAATKQGLYHVGVNPANTTARQIYWRLTSAAEGFVFKLITFLWNPRTRR